MITTEDIEYVARLAKLNLSSDEKEMLTSQMDGIVEMANKISSLDTTGVNPTNHILEIKNVFREDEVRESYSREDILKNAPAKEAGCLVVPNVV